MRAYAASIMRTRSERVPGVPADPSRAGGAGQLLERATAISAVRGTLTDARQGGSAAVFIVGEAGLGKTSVLDIGLAAAGGFEVVHGQGEATEVSLPFGFLADPLARAGFPDLLTVIPGLPPEERAAAAWHRLWSWVGQDRSRPLLLLLDDFHWADADSISLVRFLVRRLPARGVAVVAGLRPWPEAAAVTSAGLEERGQARVVRLLPLSPAASTRLVTNLREGDPAGMAVTAKDIAMCAGNPFLLRHLAWHTEGDLRTDRSGTPVAAQRGLLLARFAGFDASELEYARAGAVLGVRFRVDIAGRLTRLEASAAGTALEALHAAGLLRTVEPGTAAFTHAMLRQALYDDLSLPVRTAMHAAAFRLLWEHGAPAGEAAAHAVAARLVGDAEAVAAAERAGRDAIARGALRAAVPWLKASQRMAGDRAEASLQLRLAEALHTAGAPGEAATACRVLLSQPDLALDHAAEANRLLGRSLFELGESETAVECLRRTAGLAARNRSSLAIEALLEASMLTLYTHGPRRSLALADEAKLLIDESTDGSLAAWVGAARGHARLLRGDEGGADEVDRAMDGLPAGGGIRGLHGSAAYGPRLAHLQSLKFTERFGEAEAAYNVALREAVGTGIPLAMSIYGVAHADTLCRLGRLREAEELLNQAREESYGLVSRAPWTEVGLAHINFELDRPDQATAHCQAIEASIGAEGESLPLLRFWLWRVRAGLALRLGDAETASALMIRAEATADSSGVVAPAASPWYSVAVDAHLAAGRTEDARRVLNRLEMIGKSTGHRWPHAVVARGRALLADFAGDRVSAESHFDRALKCHRGLPMPVDEVETLVAYGAFLRRSGSPVGARAPLARAERMATDCGALRLQRVASQELHAASGRRRRRATEPGLTAVQTKVASLAARGLTNAEIGRQLFISPRTVEHHLTAIYASLSVATRRELRRLAESGAVWPESSGTCPQPTPESVWVADAR